MTLQEEEVRAINLIEARHQLSVPCLASAHLSKL